MSLTLLFAVALFVDQVFASSDEIGDTDRLITIHDQGVEQTIVTKANTVRAALKQAGVNLQPLDQTEPSADTAFIAKSYQVNVYHARPVTVIDGQKQVKVVTAEQSPRQIVAAAGLKLDDEDTTQIGRVDNVLDGGGAGLQLLVDRATPFSLVLYGKKIDARTQATTVGEMLKEKDIHLGPKDGVSQPMNAGLVAGMSVNVWREGVQTITLEEEIPMPVREVKDADKELGYKQVQTPGVAGRKQVTYEINIQAGQELSRKEIQSVVTAQPLEQVVIVGTKPKGAYTTPSENENITWNYLMAHGFTRNQTAGIMGNLKQEHGFNTTGDGLAQWTGARKARLMAMPDPYNIYTQLDFMMSELNGGYASTRDAIRASTTVDQAVVIFQNKYEGCGVCMQSSRIAFAYDILASH